MLGTCRAWEVLPSGSVVLSVDPAAAQMSSVRCHRSGVTDLASLVGAGPLEHRPLEGFGDVGPLRPQLVEVGPEQRPGGAWLRRADGRGAALAFEDGDLAEEVAAPEDADR